MDWTQKTETPESGGLANSKRSLDKRKKYSETGWYDKACIAKPGKITLEASFLTNEFPNSCFENRNKMRLENYRTQITQKQYGATGA